jgi:hypothetical protein
MNRTNTGQNLRRAFVLFIGIALTAAACSTSDGEATTTSPPTTSAATPSTPQPPAWMEVEIEGDKISYLRTVDWEDRLAATRP